MNLHENGPSTEFWNLTSVTNQQTTQKSECNTGVNHWYQTASNWHFKFRFNVFRKKFNVEAKILVRLSVLVLLSSTNKGVITAALERASITWRGVMTFSIMNGLITHSFVSFFQILLVKCCIFLSFNSSARSGCQNHPVAETHFSLPVSSSSCRLPFLFILYLLLTDITLW